MLNEGHLSPTTISTKYCNKSTETTIHTLDLEYLGTQLMVWNLKSSKFYRVDKCVS